MFAQAVCEALDVEFQLLGVADQVARLEGVLVVEHEVVHLPERVLVGRGLCGLGGKLSMGVDVVQRQVSPDIADLCAEIAEELADDRFRLPAIGTLEVSVLEQRHGRI